MSHARPVPIGTMDYGFPTDNFQQEMRRKMRGKVKIYEYRIRSKFESIIEVICNYDWNNTPEFPCLILLHPNTEEDIANLYNKHKDEINGSQAAVLVLSTDVYKPPRGANSDFFHCLSYGILTPCKNDLIRTRFNKLIEQVERLSDWSNVDMRSLWEIVDPPYPEYLVAWYLLLVARGQDVTITELHDLSSQAQREFEMLCAEYDMTGTRFDRLGIATLFSKAG